MQQYQHNIHKHEDAGTDTIARMHIINPLHLMAAAQGHCGPVTVNHCCCAAALDTKCRMIIRIKHWLFYCFKYRYSSASEEAPSVNYSLTREEKKQNNKKKTGIVWWYLTQHKFSVHVHGEVAKMKQHLVGGELLLRHILPVENDDGHTQEQVEIVRLWGRGKENGGRP